MGATTNGPLSLLLDVLAVHRLVRLVTADAITAPLRDGVIAGSYGRATAGKGATEDLPPDDWTEYAIADADSPPLATLASCRWCCSVYVAFGVVALRRLAPRAWSPMATALALSSASTLLAGLED